MNEFWKRSPEWQREQDLYAEFKTATATMEEEGSRVLACIRNDNDSPIGGYWHERRQTYKDAVERYEEAYGAWRGAREAFKASPVGQAYHRWRRDPLNRPPEAFAPAPEEAAA